MTIGAQSLKRADGRLPLDLRPLTLTLGVQKWPEGSCLIKVGGTEVICSATIEDKVPPHLRGKGTGWVTAEYSMLPRATSERNVQLRDLGLAELDRLWDAAKVEERTAAGDPSTADAPTANGKEAGR